RPAVVADDLHIGPVHPALPRRAQGAENRFLGGPEGRVLLGGLLLAVAEPHFAVGVNLFEKRVGVLVEQLPDPRTLHHLRSESKNSHRSPSVRNSKHEIRKGTEPNTSAVSTFRISCFEFRISTFGRSWLTFARPVRAGRIRVSSELR